MQVIACSGVKYSQTTPTRDISLVEDPRLDECGQQQVVQSTNNVPNGASKSMDMERKIVASQGSEASLNNGASRDHGVEHKRSNGSVVVDTAEHELPNGNGVDPKWLDGDESLALWVKWRGKWQAGIRCSRADWPLSALKSKPSHDNTKKCFVVFFPQTKIHCWADTPLVCSINELPHPIGHKTHRIGLEMVKDSSVARRFIMQNLAVAMVNIVEQFHTEALIATAREVAVWKTFALEVYRCIGYPDLGRMLLKLQNMISTRYINAEWLLSSFNSWVQRCQNTNSAESVEMLEEELFVSLRWNEIHSLREAQAQPTLGLEWKTWKNEAMKLFLTSNPVPAGVDSQQWGSDGSLSTSPQVSRKRPKLEVRRAESHAFPVETRDSNQPGTIEIDSEFFNNRGIANKWNEIVVVEPGTGAVSQTNGETTPKVLEPGNKNRQCAAYIESKGRQCVRWANDGDVYCCVHLSSRFASGGSGKAEGTTLSTDTPMCAGTTVLGTKCKHRSLPGTTFCKKHRPKTEMEISNMSSQPLKRKYDESVHSHGKELALVGDSLTEASQGLSNVVVKPELLEYRSAEVSQCIGSYSRDNAPAAPCLESSKRHGLYCEKHLPSWLKRARNGKSRIVSKEVFVELLRDCHGHEQKVHLHQACELFYRLFKSILSLRNPVPKEVQFQWALSEASKDVGVGDFFMKLVTSEKGRLVRIWGFDPDEDAQISSSVRDKEPVPQLRLTAAVSRDDDDDDEKSIKCKVCAEPFLNDQALGDHWRDSHKKEAQWLFRGYACAICLDSFVDKQALESHVQERHYVQFVEQCMLLQCIPCRGHFGNAEELWNHVLSAHPEDFRLSKGAKPMQQPTAVESPPAKTLTSGGGGGDQRFICKLCGLRFDLLPDLGRHHQAAHMGPPSLLSGRPAKRGVRYYAYRMKSGRLSRPKFKKTAAAASYRIRNRAADNIKKRIQASKALGTGGGISAVQPRLAEGVVGGWEESQCSSVSQILFSEIQKTKHRPNNADILSVARSACCKVNLKTSLEATYGVLPERLYLKAAKICGEHNILVNWHQDGFVCPRGCRAFNDPHPLPPLKTRTNSIGGHRLVCSSEPVDEHCRMDECHYVLDSVDLRQSSVQNFNVLCEDISFGKESVRVACVVDYRLSDSDGGESIRHTPWESFTYIAKPLIDQSIALETQSSNTGCVCPHTHCCPESCDHVYLFDCDYEDARDVFGKPMRGRFPYDERSRIILEEGYLVYECNPMCSCPRTCPNRVLQNGVRLKLEVFKTLEKGWGVRSGEAIMRGTFICEYAGEVLDEQEANVRRERYGKEGCGYLFEIDSHVNDMSRLIEGQSRYVIDSTKYGNVSRFINHSCLPNLVSHQVLVESMDCQGSHIGLYASRDISLGEELAYDYCHSFRPAEGFSCLCKASTCRGQLQ